MTKTGRRVAVLMGGLLIAAVAGGVALGSNATSFAASAGQSPPAGTPSPSPADASAAPAASSTASSADAGSSGPSSAPSGTATAAPTSGPAAATTSTATGRTVDVTLAYAHWDASAAQIEAAGFVAGVVENGGVCTLTARSGSSSVQATATAEPDATTTGCGQLTVPRAQLSPGTWQVTMSYRSAGAHGSSTALSLTVPTS